MRKTGVKTVICLRSFDTDSGLMRGTGLRYYHISFKPFHPEEEDVIAFLRIVADPANQPVFVHCRQGLDRTGMMVAVYRMVLEGWPRERAIAEMKAAGFNDGWQSIEHYLRTCDFDRLQQALRTRPSTRADASRP